MSRNVVTAFAALLLALGVAAFLALRGDQLGPAAGPGAPLEQPGPDPGARPAPLTGDVRSADPAREPLVDSELAAALPGGFGFLGTVRGTDGSPASGSAVWLLRADREERIGSTTADGRGRFALPLGFDDDLGQPAFRIAAHHPDHGLAAPVEIARPLDGGTARIDLVLDVLGLAITGVLRGPAADPVPDYPIALVRADEAPEVGPEWLAGRSQVEIRTGGAGGFVARGLRAGTWEIDFEPPDVPVGFDVDPPALRIQVAAGAAGLDLRLPFVRVEFEVVAADDRPRVVDRVAVRAFSRAEADAAAVRFENREDLDAPPIDAERRRREDAAGITVYAAPGTFLVASAAEEGTVSELGVRVAAEPSVRTERVVVGSTATTARLQLRVLRPDGSAPALVLFRARRPDGLLVAPPQLEDVGEGWRRLPAGGQIAMPPGKLRFELLGDPFDAGRTWHPTASLPAEFDWSVSRSPASDARTVRLQHGAWVDVEIVQGGSPATAAARAAWLDERLPGDVPVVKGYASIEPARGAERPLRLAWIAPDGTWHVVRGVPYRPNEIVVVRALGVVEPGPCRFAIQTWRPARVEDAAGWPLDLQPGRNVVRLRMDTDAVLHGPGR